jgi:hypothetical protein
MKRQAAHIAKLAFSAAVGLLLLIPTAFADPVVMNGSFEAIQIGSPFYSSNPGDVPNWTHTGPVGDALLWAIGYNDGGGGVTVAGDGKQFVTLGGGFRSNGNGTTSQWSTTITGLITGQSYILNFMTASEAPFSGAQTMSVGFSSGSSTPSQSFTSAPSPGNYWKNWVTQSETFVATDISAVVDFSVTNQQYDMGLDKVSVSLAPSTVPEPSSLLLLSSGLVALSLALKKVIA